MESWLLEYGYPARFLLSFLASTVVPLGSEWLLAVLLLNGFEAAWVVPVATAGNTCGALTTYAIGLWGGPLLVERVLRISPETQKKAEQRFSRYGSWSLLFSWGSHHRRPPVPGRRSPENKPLAIHPVGRHREIHPLYYRRKTCYRGILHRLPMTTGPGLAISLFLWINVFCQMSRPDP